METSPNPHAKNNVGTPIDVYIKMTEKEKQTESLILIALAKAFTEQSTLLTGELRHKTKQTFNLAVKQVDLFIKTIEDTLTEDQKEYLSSLGDIYHNINLEIRKQK